MNMRNIAGDWFDDLVDLEDLDESDDLDDHFWLEMEADQKFD